MYHNFNNPLALTQHNSKPKTSKTNPPAQNGFWGLKLTANSKDTWLVGGIAAPKPSTGNNLSLKQHGTLTDSTNTQLYSRISKHYKIQFFFFLLLFFFSF